MEGDVKMNSFLIVGRKDCPTLEVHNIFRLSTSFHLFRDKWVDVARHLNIPEVSIAVIKQDMLLDKISLSYALKQMLDEWVSREGHSASLEKLIESLEYNGLKECSERLKKKFELNTGKARGNNKQFLIVGTENCSLLNVHKILRFSPSFHLFYEKWIDIARSLNISEMNIQILRQDIMLNKISLSDALRQIIQMWVCTEASAASLEKLIRTLEENGLADCAEMLRKEFQFYTNTANKYCCIPRALNDVLNSSDFPSGLIILTTLDVIITMEKIRENLPNCETFLSYESLLNFLSDGNEWSMLVVTDKDANTLANLLENMSGSKPFDQHGRIAFITSEDEEKIKNLLVKAGVPSDYIKVIRDEMEWNDLNLSAKHDVRKRAECFVSFRLQDGCLQSALSGRPLADLINRRMDLLLIKSTLPPTFSYYIERHLITRNNISEAVFQSSCEDVFLFEGISRFEISRIVRNKLTANSSEQLRNLTSKLIVLDHLNHFTKICQLSDCPVHLLRKEEEGKWRWIKSKGTMQQIQKYISQGEAQDVVDEDEFFTETDRKSSPVCIAGSPGMGKSFLLAQIGRKLKKEYPERIVAFVVWAEFMREVKDMGTDDLKISIGACLKKLIAENHLGAIYLEAKLNEDSDKIWFELLLDGIDEVAFSDHQLSHKLLKTIKSFKSIRLWITSRPHLLEDLEDTLGILGYNIQPLSENNQIHFLTRFWSESFGMPDENFGHFASICLQSLKKNFNPSDEDAFGSPLQCLMIAKIFQDEARANADSHVATVSLNSFTFTDLNDLLIKKKIELYFKRHDGGKLMQDEILSIHKWLSLQLLFPDYASKAIPKEMNLNRYFEEIIRIGLLEGSSTISAPRFIDRNVAEYLVANFAVEMLSKPRTTSTEFTNLLYEDLLAYTMSGDSVSGIRGMFRYPVICRFINSLLSREYQVSLPEPKDLLTTQEIMLVCVIHNFTNIFKLFIETEMVKKFASVVFNKNLLLVSVGFANLNLTKNVAEQFERNNQFTAEIKEETFRQSMIRMDFGIIEYFLKEKGFKELLKSDPKYMRTYLIGCVGNTNEMDECLIGNRLEIIRALLSVNQLAAREYLDGLLLEDKIHIKIIIELINLGVNLMQRDSVGQTILHRASGWLKETDYAKLVQHILPEIFRQLVLISDRDGVTPLHLIVVKFDLKELPLQLFAYLNVSFNQVDKNGDNLLAYAVKRKRSIEALRTLINFGVNWKCVNLNGWNLLHHSVFNENIEGLKYFLELGLSPNSSDNEGRTPLILYLCKVKQIDLQIIEVLIKSGADINREDNRGRAPLHCLIYQCSNTNSSVGDLIKVLKYMIDVGANFYGRDVQDQTFSHKFIPFLGCSEFHEFVEYLLEKGLSSALNLGGFDNCTPIHLAVNKIDVEERTLALLHSAGVNFNCQDDDGDNILTYAIKGKRDVKLINRLIKFGADFNHLNKHGCSLLHTAAQIGTVETLGFLIGVGLDINRQDCDGDTPLHCSMNADDVNGVEEKCVLLLEEGADPNIKNQEGLYPLAILMQRNNIAKDVKEKLLEKINLR